MQGVLNCIIIFYPVSCPSNDILSTLILLHLQYTSNEIIWETHSFKTVSVRMSCNSKESLIIILCYSIYGTNV